MERHPQERNTCYLEDKLAYRKKTNVTTEVEGTHHRELSDTPETDPTMPALSQLELGMVARDGTGSLTRFWLPPIMGGYTKDGSLQQNMEESTGGNRVPEMARSSSSPVSSLPTIEHLDMAARLAAKPIVTHKDDNWNIDRPRSHTTRRLGLRCLLTHPTSRQSSVELPR